MPALLEARALEKFVQPLLDMGKLSEIFESRIPCKNKRQSAFGYLEMSKKSTY